MDGISLRPRPGVRIREFEPADEDGLLAVFKASADYFESATGSPAEPGDVQSLFYALPEGMSEDDKHILVIEQDGELAGMVDAVLGYPERDACAVGLFLVAAPHRRQGLGRLAAEALCGLAREAGLRRMTATTPAAWAPGKEFLEDLGFRLEAPGADARQTDNRNHSPAESPVLRAELRLTAG